MRYDESPSAVGEDRKPSPLEQELNNAFARLEVFKSDLERHQERLSHVAVPRPMPSAAEKKTDAETSPTVRRVKKLADEIDETRDRFMIWAEGLQV